MSRYNAAIHNGLTAGPLIGYLARGNAAFLIYSLLCLPEAVILHFGLTGASPTPRVPGRRVRPEDVGRLLAAPGVGLDLWGILLWGGACGMFLTLAAFGLGTFCRASMARLNDVAPAELKGSISGAYYLAWGLGISVAAVAVESLSTRLHPGAGFVVF